MDADEHGIATIMHIIGTRDANALDEFYYHEHVIITSMTDENNTSKYSHN